MDNVLEGLVGTCFYLNWDRNRYRFGLTPNLNQILVVRRGAVQPKAITERIRKDTEKGLPGFGWVYRGIYEQSSGAFSKA